MFLTTGEIAIAGITATLLASGVTNVLNNHGQSSRLKAETARERERWDREDRRATAERWAERRYEAHSAFANYLSGWLLAYEVMCERMLTHGTAGQEELHAVLRDRNLAAAMKSKLKLISSKEVQDAAEWVVQAVYAATETYVLHARQLREGPTSEEFNPEADLTRYHAAFRRYDEAARAELGTGSYNAHT